MNSNIYIPTHDILNYPNSSYHNKNNENKNNRNCLSLIIYYINILIDKLRSL
jgi:hypothetical protein